MWKNQLYFISHYKKISRFFFHYLVFLIAIILWILLFQKTISEANTISIFKKNDTFSLQKTKLIAEFSKFTKQTIHNDDIIIHILQGDLQTEKWFITSVNNLITYKWFVLPKYFYMYETIPIKQLSYFSWTIYDNNELENILNTFVFTKKFTIKKPFTRVYLPINETLVQDFNLACVFENKLSSRTCNYYLNDFLDTFFIYNLSKDYIGLQSIFDTIKKNTLHKGKFCQWLSKYLLYTNDYTDSVEKLFFACGQSYVDTFKRTTLFMEIQKSLENQLFDKTVYKDDVLNTYKLLSYQQQIYQDFFINKIDTYKIGLYFDFIRELIKKNTIDPFYIDEIYRYNNKYLVSALEKITYQSHIFTQNLWSSKIAALLTTINIINEWEPLLGFSWLILSVHNKSIIHQTPISTWQIATIDIKEKIEKKLDKISYLLIDKKNISDTIIDIVGYLKFSSSNTTENIYSHIILEYSNDILLVKNIELQNKADMNDVISNLLLIQNFSLWELYSYISKNLVFYEQENAVISSSNDLCPKLKSLTDTRIITCTHTQVVIEKNDTIYTFDIQNGALDNIKISDPNIENIIKPSYSTILWTNSSIIDTLQAIINYKIASNWHEWTTNAIVVFERIQQYLWIKAHDIADKGTTILVDISLWWINFIANYTLQTNTLGPWYFKDILANGKPYMIQNFNLPLDDSHQNSINSFVIDPLTAIKNTNITAWQNYNERLKESKKN